MLDIIERKEDAKRSDIERNKTDVITDRRFVISHGKRISRFFKDAGQGALSRCTALIIAHVQQSEVAPHWRDSLARLREYRP